MNKPTPIKRITELQPLSRDHHKGLLFCWKLRQGINKGVEPERMGAYAFNFFNMHLIIHFEEEENFVFPILGNDHVIIIRALEEHQKLRSMFQGISNVEEASDLTNLLEAHIRFEEREVFPAIEKIANPVQLSILEEHHSGRPFVDEWKDEFWS